MVAPALELDPTSPQAHLRHGDLRSLLHWDWAGARAAYEKSLELDPTFAEAHRHLSTLELIQGHTSEALAHIEQALALEPLSSVLRGEAGWTYLNSGDFDAALQHCDRALAIDPTAWHARQCAMYASAELGDDDRTHREAARLLDARNAAEDLPPSESMTLPVFHRRYLTVFGNTGWDRMERVLTLAALGETDHALTALDAALADRLPQALFRLRDPRLRPLRKTQRFGEIAARLQLERQL